MNTNTSTPTPHGTDVQLAEVSALLDGELPHNRVLEVVDRLLDTRECHDFYRKSRALSGIVAATSTTALERAPDHVWEQIADRIGGQRGEHLGGQGDSGKPQDAPSGPGFAERINRWLSRWVQTEMGPLIATAAILIALAGLTWIGLRDGSSDRLNNLGPDTESGAVSERSVQLGSDEDMSESRFIDLATEILQADERYRRELLKLMSDIEGRPNAEEGFSEGMRDRSERSSDSRDGFGIEPLEDAGGNSRVRVPLW